MTHGRIDITGTESRSVVIALTDEARAALIEQGLTDPPAELTFYFQELSTRQTEALNREVNALAQDALLQTLMERTAAPGTDPRAIAELIRDLRSTQAAMFIAAYASGGIIPDAKKTARAVGRVQGSSMSGLLDLLGSDEPSPSSPATTG